MLIWRDCWSMSIRVTDERLAHVLEHPEMAGQQAALAETLAEPHQVVQSRSDEDVRLYHRLCDDSPVGAKYLCVVVKWRSDDPFLVTAYFTDRVKQGTRLWPM